MVLIGQLVAMTHGLSLTNHLSHYLHIVGYESLDQTGSRQEDGQLTFA